MPSFARKVSAGALLYSLGRYPPEHGSPKQLHEKLGWLPAGASLLGPSARAYLYAKRRCRSENNARSRCACCRRPPSDEKHHKHCGRELRRRRCAVAAPSAPRRGRLLVRIRRRRTLPSSAACGSMHATVPSRREASLSPGAPRRRDAGRAQEAAADSMRGGGLSESVLAATRSPPPRLQRA